MFPATAAPALGRTSATFTVPFQSFFDTSVADYKIAVRLQPYDDVAGSVTDIYIADRGFATSADDTPASAWFAPRLKSMNLRRSVSGRRLGGTSQLRSASIEIENGDQSIKIDGAPYNIKSLFDRFTLDGRRVEIKLLPSGTKFSEGLEIFTGTAENWAASDRGVIAVTLRSSAYLLDTPLQPATFGGTGGVDGGAELEGKRPPICFGECFNVEPTLIIPGQNDLVYMLHTDKDGAPAPIESVLAVRIGGVSLNFAADYADLAALQAATAGSPGDDIEPGEYATCLAEGLIRLGASPGATLTCDVKGGKFSGNYVDLPGAVAKTAIQLYGPQLADSDLDIQSFRVIDQSIPWSVNRYISPDEDLTAAEFLSEICGSIESSWGDDRSGKIGLRRTEAPKGAFSMSFEPRHILDGGWRWLTMPSDVRPAIKSITVGYALNYTPSGDLASSVVGEDRVALQQKSRTVTKSQSVDRHAEAQTLFIDTLLTSKSNAEALADFLLDLYAGGVLRASMSVAHRAWGLAIGQKIQISLSEEGVSDTLARVMGLTFDSDGPLELEVILESTT